MIWFNATNFSPFSWFLQLIMTIYQQFLLDDSVFCQIFRIYSAIHFEVFDFLWANTTLPETTNVTDDLDVKTGGSSDNSTIIALIALVSGFVLVSCIYALCIIYCCECQKRDNSYIGSRFEMKDIESWETKRLPENYEVKRTHLKEASRMKAPSSAPPVPLKRPPTLESAMVRETFTKKASLEPHDDSFHKRESIL